MVCYTHHKKAGVHARARDAALMSHGVAPQKGAVDKNLPTLEA